MLNTRWPTRRAFASCLLMTLLGCDVQTDDADPQGEEAAHAPGAPTGAPTGSSADPAGSGAPGAGTPGKPGGVQPSGPTTVLSDWTEDAIELPIGAVATYRCLPGRVEGTVWGTDLYTADSSLCGAALHAGVTTREGNTDFTIEVLGGAAAFLGSARNDVVSTNYGPYPKSFRFIAAGAPLGAGRVAPTQALTIKWDANAGSLAVGSKVTYRCLPGGLAGSVYGTDVYTADSSICGAAMHAGKTTLAGETDFGIEVMDGAAAFQGSMRNGVSSRNYGPYSKTFRFAP
jgi:hypothetical protein